MVKYVVKHVIKLKTCYFHRITITVKECCTCVSLMNEKDATLPKLTGNLAHSTNQLRQ